MSIDNAINNAIQYAIRRTSGDERRMYIAIEDYQRTGNAAYQQEASRLYHRLSFEAQQRANYLGDIVNLAGPYHY